MKNLSSLDELRAALRRFAAARDWEQFHTPKNLAMALSVEAAELLEQFQWLTPEQSKRLDARHRRAAPKGTRASTRSSDPGRARIAARHPDRRLFALPYAPAPVAVIQFIDPLNPMSHFRHHVFFCCNQRTNGEACCNDRGAAELRDYAKAKVKALGLSGEGKVRVNMAGCLDRCNEGPVIVVYPEEVWYTYVDREDIDEIISEHLQNGRVVERLKI